MASSAQIELWHAEKVATTVEVVTAPNGIHNASLGETRISDTDLERLVGAVPASIAPALAQRAYYFVPLAIADTGETMIAPSYNVELGDRAVCHRNASFGATEAVFLSTKIVVMSPRPGRIIDIIPCDFPRNRTLEIRETPEFTKIAQRVRAGLRSGHSYDE